MNALSESELALARRNTYALLSRLFLDGIVDDLLPYINAIPELEEALEAHPAESRAAWHYDLFGLAVQPYESFFLSADGLVGGAIGDAVQRDYQRARFHLSPTASYGPDHAGAELHFMAVLCGHEADALNEGAAEKVDKLRTHQRKFLDGHLLRWFVPLSVAVQKHGNEFFTRVTALTQDLLTSHHADLLQAADIAPSGRPFTLPDLPGSFDDPGLDLETISEWLCTPAYSGIYLSRQEIGGLGRKLQLPIGFQSRAKQLHHLFTSSGEYDQEQVVIQELQTLFVHWKQRYQEAQSEASYVTVWLDRVSMMIDNLQHMAAALEHNSVQETEL